MDYLAALQPNLPPSTEASLPSQSQTHLSMELNRVSETELESQLAKFPRWNTTSEPYSTEYNLVWRTNQAVENHRYSKTLICVCFIILVWQMLSDTRYSNLV